MATPEEVRPKMLNSLNEYRWLRNYCEAYNQILGGRGPLLERLRTHNPKYFEDGTVTLKSKYRTREKLDDIIWENRDVLELGDGRRDFKRRDFNRLSNYSRELSGDRNPPASDTIAPLREQYIAASEKRELDSLNDYNTKVQEQKAAVKQRRKATRGVVGRSVLFALGLAGGLVVLGGFGAAVWATVGGALTTTFGLTTGAGMVGVIGGVLAGKWLIGKFASLMKTLRQNFSTAIKQRKEARRSVKEKKRERKAARSIYHKNALANAIDRTSEASYPYERYATDEVTRTRGMGRRRAAEAASEFTAEEMEAARARTGARSMDAPEREAEERVSVPPTSASEELGDGRAPKPTPAGDGAHSTPEPRSREEETFTYNYGPRGYDYNVEMPDDARPVGDAGDGTGSGSRRTPRPDSTYARYPFGFPPAGGSGDDTASGDTATSDLDRSTSAGTSRPAPGFVPPITPVSRPRRAESESEEERALAHDPVMPEDARPVGGAGNSFGSGSGSGDGFGSGAGAGFRGSGKGAGKVAKPKSYVVTLNDVKSYLKNGKELNLEKLSSLAQYLGIGSKYHLADLRPDFVKAYKKDGKKLDVKAFNNAVKEAEAFEDVSGIYENENVEPRAARLIDLIRAELGKEPLRSPSDERNFTEFRAPIAPETPEMPDAVANDPELELTDIVRATGFEDYLLSIRDNYNPDKDDINEIKRNVEEQKGKFFEAVESRVEQYNNDEANLNPITIQMVASLENEANEYVEDILNSMQNASANEITEPETPAIDPETALNNAITRQRDSLDYDSKLVAIADDKSLDKPLKIEQMRSLRNELISRISEFYNSYNVANKSKITGRMYQDAIDDLNVELFEMLNSENLEEIKPEEPKPEESSTPETPESNPEELKADPNAALEDIINKAKSKYSDSNIRNKIESKNGANKTKVKKINDQIKKTRETALNVVKKGINDFNAAHPDSQITEEMREYALAEIKNDFDRLSGAPVNSEPTEPQVPTEPKSEEQNETKPVENEAEETEPEMPKLSLLLNEQMRNYLGLAARQLLSEGKEVNKDSMLARAYDLSHETEDETGKGFEPAVFADLFGKEEFNRKFDQEEADEIIARIIEEEKSKAKEAEKPAEEPEKPEPEPEKPKDNPVPKTSENKNNNKGKGKPGKNSGKGSEGPQPGEE